MQVAVSVLCISSRHRFGCVVADGILYVPADVKRFLDVHGITDASAFPGFVRTHVPETALAFGWDTEGVRAALSGLCDVLRGHLPSECTDPVGSLAR